MNERTVIVKSNEEHFACIEASRNVERGAIDIETTVEPNPFLSSPQLVSVALTFDGETAYVYRPGFYWDRIRTVLEGKNWIMHNGLFDRLMLKAFFGADLPLEHDTMAMQYLLDPDKPKGLQDLSVEYLGLEAYKDVDYKNILDEPFEKVAEMNAEDARRTYRLFRPLADQLNANPKLSRVYQWILMPAVNDLIEVTQNGIPLDSEALSEITAKYELEVEELLKWLQDRAPKPDPERYPKGWPKPGWWRVGELGQYDGSYFNPGSWQQVGHVLFDLWNLTPLEWNEDSDGNPTSPSTSADVLLRIETHEAEGVQEVWLSKLREYRKATKLLSYFHAWPDLQDWNGWLHPRYKPLHVVTGRLSSETPNIQNVPRTKEVRSCFRAPEGYVWMKADYSQVELRLAALAAQEERMLLAYKRGDDLHTLTAKLVLGDESPDARQVGKTLNFGLLYGAGPATLARVARNDYGVFFTLDEARYYSTEFFHAYPGLAQWHAKEETKIEQTGVSYSPLGRVRYLPKAKIPRTVNEMWGQKMGAIREGINHQIQSYASDLLLGAMNRVLPRIEEYGAFMVAEVHDEMDFLVPEQNVSQVARIVKDTMEDTSWLKKFGISLGVPLLAEVEVGPSWGEVEAVE